MTRILKITINPNPILRKVSEEISPEEIGSKKINELCLNMAETMVKKDGVGLAAPQVGKNIRAVVVNTKDGPVFMVNPKIKNKSLTKEWGEEGCLSVPGVFGQVKRHKSLICVFYDIKGKKNQMKAKGLLARVIQHEIDHLDGILFIDKAKDIK
ncbi:MAG: peptide deformylase [Patescibacteria group bacterium]